MNKMYADGHNWNQTMCFTMLFSLQLTFLLGGALGRCHCSMLEGTPLQQQLLSSPQLDTVHMELISEPGSAYSLPSSALNSASEMLYDSQF